MSVESRVAVWREHNGETWIMNLGCHTVLLPPGTESPYLELISGQVSVCAQCHMGILRPFRAEGVVEWVYHGILPGSQLELLQ